ncbi:MAG: nucleoside transporter NupC [Myxococcales bacterium]
MTRRLPVGRLLVVAFLALVALGVAPSAEGASPVVPAAAQVFRDHETTLADRALSVLGIPALLAVAWLLSKDRRAIKWRPVAWGIGLQILFGLVVLSPTVGDAFFSVVDQGVGRLLSFAERGADFVFQAVVPHESVHYADDGTRTTTVVIGHMSPVLKTVAFWVLPTIIFFSSLMTLLYHLGAMQPLVRLFAWAMQKTMGTSGSESLSCASNIFVGQTEAPLVIRPFLETMTRSELHAMMVGGFATVAGGVLAVYVKLLQHVPGIAGHLVTASIMSAPAALAVSKILVPETEPSTTAGSLKMHVERPDANSIEAVARGATDGLLLAANVAAMLIAFIAMVALADWMLGVVGLSLSEILGWVFRPFAFLMGVPWSESDTVGRLLGEKLVLTELIAYIHLGELLSSGKAVLSERSVIITSYALCGFANFASIGIQIGGIGAIAPSRRRDLAQLGLLAMVGGTLAAFLTANVVGILK